MALSSAQELLEAVNKLAGSNQETGDAEKAHKTAGEIATGFEGVNTDLKDGWTTTQDFFLKLATHIQENIADLAAAMANFSADTIDAEMAAATASSEANSAAEDILNELEGELQDTGAATSNTGATSNPEGTGAADDTVEDPNDEPAGSNFEDTATPPGPSGGDNNTDSAPAPTPNVPNVGEEDTRPEPTGGQSDTEETTIPAGAELEDEGNN